jgi:hypothetical protein
MLFAGWLSPSHRRRTMDNDKTATLVRLALFLEREAHTQGYNIEVEITKIIEKLKGKK